MEQSFAYTIGYLIGIGFALSIVVGIPAAVVFSLQRAIKRKKEVE